LEFILSRTYQPSISVVPTTPIRITIPFTVLSFSFPATILPFPSDFLPTDEPSILWSEHAVHWHNAISSAVLHAESSKLYHASVQLNQERASGGGGKEREKETSEKQWQRVIADEK
jgi:hypothetical protein